MKRIFVLAVLVTALAMPAAAQLEFPRLSPKATVSQTIGLTDVTIQYSRPSVRGREIWGGLVPYGEVWRTGANEATTFEVTDDVTIEGQALPAGLYSVHTIPGPDQWTVIFNNQAEQWGSYSYDAAKDAIRVTVTPRRSDEMRELMTFAFPTVSADGAEIMLAWENLEVPIRLGVATNEMVLSSIERALDWRVPYQAASWAFQNEIAGADAMAWVDRSVAMEATWQNLQLKARMQAAAGNRKDAIATGERALRLAKEMENPPNTASFEMAMDEWRRAR
ncbi:MAG: DUF2911 domain-containing protein [Thermoanaerobaculia bacterium]